jgi:tRNA-Thr(GGU) m(6)t(6)A37 methyltransferase TsaA
MSDKFQIYPVGFIRKQDKAVIINIYHEYVNGLLGLDQFSHIEVCYWFHKNDTKGKRDVLQVHPRGDRENPLTGVFATRSPLRPNLIGMSVCRILSINENIINIDKIDAFNGSPVVDIKPYIPRIDSVSDAVTPGWAVQ